MKYLLNCSTEQDKILNPKKHNFFSSALERIRTHWISLVRIEARSSAFKSL